MFGRFGSRPYIQNTNAIVAAAERDADQPRRCAVHLRSVSHSGPPRQLRLLELWSFFISATTSLLQCEVETPTVAWIIPRLRVRTCRRTPACHATRHVANARVGTCLFKCPFEHADDAADPQREPARPQTGARRSARVAGRVYVSPPARREPAHRERDRDRQVEALGEPEHRHRDRAVARGDRGRRQPVVLVAEHHRERRRDVDVVDRRAGAGGASRRRETRGRAARRPPLRRSASGAGRSSVRAARDALGGREPSARARSRAAPAGRAPRSCGSSRRRCADRRCPRRRSTTEPSRAASTCVDARDALGRQHRLERAADRVGPWRSIRRSIASGTARA